MPKRTVGSKGQVVIPESIRKALGIKPGSNVILEISNGEIVIRPELKPSEFVEYYTRTCAKKLRKGVDVNKVIVREGMERFGLSG